MKTPDYKTLLYMQGLGAPVDELIQARQYNAIKRNIEGTKSLKYIYELPESCGRPDTYKMIQAI